MDEVQRDLLNPAWWFSVVIVAFLVGLFVEYTKPLVAAAISRLSAALRDTNQKWTDGFDQAVQCLLEDPNHAVRMQVRCSSYGTRLVASLVGSLVIILMVFMAEWQRATIVTTLLDYCQNERECILVRLNMLGPLLEVSFVALAGVLVLLFVNGIMFVRSSLLLREYDRRRESADELEQPNREDTSRLPPANQSDCP